MAPAPLLLQSVPSTSAPLCPRGFAPLPRRLSMGSPFLSSGMCSSQGSSFLRGTGAGAGLAAAVQARTGSLSSGGGALGAQMNVFERFTRIIKSYTNAALSSLEDPEKMLDQTVEDMQNDLTKLRQATAQVLASTKQLENKYKQAAQNSSDWYARAKLALSKGEEELAKEALKRRKEYEDNAKGLEGQLSAQQQTVDKLIANTRLLEGKIQEAKAKKDTLKARAQSAKTQQKVNEVLGTISTTSSLAAFEKMEEKVLALEAESEALDQLSGDTLNSKFALLESGNVDDDLAALKSEMLGQGRGSKGVLPSGRGATGFSSTAANIKDLEIEAELSELRRRAKEL